MPNTFKAVQQLLNNNYLQQQRLYLNKILGQRVCSVQWNQARSQVLRFEEAKHIVGGMSFAFIVL